MYYLGATTTEVKPIHRRRHTHIRPMFKRREHRYLMKSGRKPINRRGYPTMGTPLAIDMRQEPGTSFLGASLQVLPSGFTGFTSSFSPSVSQAPAESPGLLTSLIDMWNNRPEVLKQIRVKIKPSTLMQTIQQAIPAGQVSQTVDRLRAMGLDPRMMTGAGEVPITGAMAGGAYRASAVDWSAYMPWIIGGGVALVALPALMGRR